MVLARRPTSTGEAARADLSEAGLADRLRATRETRDAAEVELLELAVEWGHAHPELDDDGVPVPVERVDDHALAAHFAGLDPEESPSSPAWAGLPPVDWCAPGGLGAACAMSTPAATGLLRDALVLAHRLPRTWRRVRAGQVPAWRARLVAREVAGAPDDVVAAIDTEFAPIADRAGIVTLRRLIHEGMVRLYPEEVELASLEALDQRFVDFRRASVNHTGIAQMDVRADYADLDDLDQTLTELAGRMVHCDPEAEHQSLAVRRARALGVLSDPVRAQELLDHAESLPVATDTGARPERRSRTRLELRITDLALLGPDPVAGLDAQQMTLLTERVAEWCGREATDLTVLPVLDTDSHAGTAGYRPTPRMVDHVDLRDRGCLFPHCTRPARGCDHDHVVAYDDGGRTCTCNVVPLCRHHHRLKTHAGYEPAIVEPGVVWWRTPHGHEFLVDHHGTAAVHRAPPPTTGCLYDSGWVPGQSTGRNTGQNRGQNI